MSGGLVMGYIILLNSILNGITVMDQKGDALRVAAIGADTDVVSFTENYNIARLPLFGIFKIAGENLCIAAEKGIQCVDTPEVDISIGNFNIRVAVGTISNVLIYHVFQ